MTGHSNDNVWPHRLAVVTAASTMLLILIGGLVTNTGSGLAVPDWPTTFGYNMFLYPWSRMVGGIFWEHTHRLIGSAVGMLTVAFAAALWWSERRRWVRWLGVAAVVGVIVQGVLGGLRVVLLEHGLAIVHGCVAQLFFALMVSLAVVTSRGWQQPAPDASLTAAERVRPLALATVPLVYLQLVFGALLTHTGGRLDAHLLFAVLVTAVLCRLVGRVLGQPDVAPWVRRPAFLVLGLLLLQLALGIGAYLWRFTVVNASWSPDTGLAILAAHRLNGAALWGASVMFVLRLLRVLGAPQMAVARRAETSVAAPLGADRGKVLA